MAMETTIRNTTTGAGSLATRTSPETRLAPVPATRPDAAAGAVSVAAPLRGKPSSAASAVQDQVARAQQALDYLARVAGQLESLKGTLTARLSGTRNSARQLESQARQLSSTLAARKGSAGGGVDANLNFSSQPATQRFRIGGLDLDALQNNGAQSLAFSVGGAGGPQLSVTLEPGQPKEAIAAAIDRAMAPMGVRAGVDDGGRLLFSTPESSWPAVKDGIAISGRGRVATEEVAPALAPQQWNTDGGGDALRQSLREVVQALERVRRSQDAASNALSAASVQMAQAATPPTEVAVAAQEFASTAANPDYESLLALTSALVGVSRERVLALLGLR
jgi:hypothetical protein